MHYVPALRVALELYHMPTRVRILRSRSLPDGIDVLLRIVGGDHAAAAEAAELTDRSADVMQNAAAFFIEQILFYPEADSYRVLGASRDAKASELRHNMALLLAWLHPDIDRGGDRSIYAARVTKAWEDLKTPERRTAYDKARHARKKTHRSRMKAAGPLTAPIKRRQSRLGHVIALPRKEPARLLQRLLSVLLGR